MKPLYCWRCKKVVPMMDEEEFAQVQTVHRAAVRAAKSYREQHNARLEDTPLTQFYRPVQVLYYKLSEAAGLETSIVDPHHILKHRLGAYGPPCTKCGLPLRTPKAMLCAACGTKRAA